MADNFFDDAFSQSASVKKDKPKKEAKKEAEEASDKRKLKVMKQALLDLRKEKEDLESQMVVLKARNKELEVDQAETSNKYLKLYDEWDMQQQQLTEINFKFVQQQAIINSLPSN